MDSVSIGSILTNAFGLVTQGITYIMGEELLMIPVGLSIGAYVIRVVKSNIRA